MGERRAAAFWAHRYASDALPDSVLQGGYVLVIEPNDLIRALVERWLADAGYTVVATAQAPQWSEARGGEPRLVIVDVPLPRRAEKIVRSVRELYGSPILLLSASLRRGAAASGDVARQLGVRAVLAKPFTRGELLSAVGQSIDRA